MGVVLTGPPGGYIFTLFLLIVLMVALLKKILRATPSKRYSIGKIREHVWCKK